VGLIALAGFGAGAMNALVGSGTLITFPTLVALGYPPVTATMSNAVGLVAGSVSGTWGYRAELAGQWNRLRWQLPASLAGAVLGAFLPALADHAALHHRGGGPDRALPPACGYLTRPQLSVAAAVSAMTSITFWRFCHARHCRIAPLPWAVMRSSS